MYDCQAKFWPLVSHVEFKLLLQISRNTKAKSAHAAFAWSIIATGKYNISVFHPNFECVHVLPRRI